MADPEHVEILKQGVKAWNEWHSSYYMYVEPDLSGLDFKTLDIKGAIKTKDEKLDITGIDFNFVDLSKADLSYVDLSRAGFYNANLNSANLFNADLLGAVLIGANLSRAYLSEADLSRANLLRATLRYADLSRTILNEAKMIETELDSVNFSRTHAVDVSFRGSSLLDANFNEAFLRRSEFCKANLCFANLEKADLKYCLLTQSDLTFAKLTGAKLYGTSRDDWVIRDIKCKYVYWDKQGKQRSPKNRDLKPQEFENIYAQLPTVEYVFKNGMKPLDPIIMDSIVDIIRKNNPEYGIKIDSINARGLAPSIKFTVIKEDFKQPAIQQIKKEYEIKVTQLEQERDRLYKLITHAIDAPKKVNLIDAQPGSFIAVDGSTINLEQHINNALDLQKAIEGAPKGSFAQIAKKTALDIVGDAMKDIAKGQVKNAAKEIVKLGIELGPTILNTAAYAFFQNIGK